MKPKNKRLLLIPILIILILGTGLIVLRSKQRTLTSYEDANGWVYECTQSIEAKKGTAQTLGHPQGLVPVDESEASRYCHKVGIE